MLNAILITKSGAAVLMSNTTGCTKANSYTDKRKALMKRALNQKIKWWALKDLNLGPIDHESNCKNDYFEWKNRIGLEQFK